MKMNKKFFACVLAAAFVLLLSVPMVWPASAVAASTKQAEDEILKEYADPNGKYQAYVNMWFTPGGKSLSTDSEANSQAFNWAAFEIYTKNTGQATFNVEEPQLKTDKGWKTLGQALYDAYGTDSYYAKGRKSDGGVYWQFKLSRWDCLEGDFIKFDIVNASDAGEKYSLSFGKGMDFGVHSLPDEYIKVSATESTLVFSLDKKVTASIADKFQYEVCDENDLSKFAGYATCSIGKKSTVKQLKANTNYIYRVRLIKDGKEGAWSAFGSATTLHAKPAKPQIKSVTVTATKNNKDTTVTFPDRWEYNNAFQSYEFVKGATRTIKGSKRVSLKVTLKKALKSGEKLYVVVGKDKISLDAMTKKSSTVYTGYVDVSKTSKSAKVKFYTAYNANVQTGESGGDPIFNETQIQSGLTAAKTVKW